MKKLIILFILCMLCVAAKAQVLPPGPVDDLQFLDKGECIYKSLSYNTNVSGDVHKVRFYIGERLNITIRFSNFYKQYTDTYISMSTPADGEGGMQQSRMFNELPQEYIEVVTLPAGYYDVLLNAFRFGGISTGVCRADVSICADGGCLPLSDTDNYVATITPTTSQSAINYSGSDILSEVQFFDGLGRPVQKVQKNITPGGNDLVYLLEYDACGRESAAWLPGLSTDTQTMLEVNTLKSASVSVNGNDPEPYAKTVYESSPLLRPLQEYGAGAAWHQAGKAIATGYLVNTVADAIPAYSSTDDLHSIRISRQGIYGAGQLYVTRKTDEDGNNAYDFNDKQGRLVLSRQMNDTVAHDTHYIYDSYSNLRAVLPPLATDILTANATWTESNTALQQYAYLYRYDSRGRCIAKKLPGADWIHFVYDKYGRLIFTQDGEMRARNRWMFTISDVFGRVVLTGTCGNTFDYTAGPLDNAEVMAEWDGLNDACKGYTVSGVSLTGTVIILKASYYDNYRHVGRNGFPAYAYDTRQEIAGYGILRTSGCKGLLTGSITAENDNGANPLHAVMYYDKDGRLIQSQSGNHLSGKETICTVYDFVGNPVKRKHIHTATGKMTQTQEFSYLYDRAGRLSKTSHRLNGATEWVVLAENEYDELGRLKDRKLHGSASANNRQSYSYNVRSWLTGISGGRFNQNLYYNTGTGTPGWNGNISSMTWRAGTEAAMRGYKFTYDGLGRMSNAVYGEGTGITGANKYGEKPTYDKHGNMLAFKRYGNTMGTIYALTDDLTFGYTGNQMRYINDVATTMVGEEFHFRNGSNSTGTEYTYDLNGNLIKDLNKNITSITYDLLNLPKRVTWSSIKYTEYTYDASGSKRRTVHKNGSSTKTTDYCGNVIYEDGVLKRILFDGGYIEDGLYYYYLRDHLGNNRVVIDSSGAVQQTNHYYPFGGLFGQSASGVQPYKYNGKELDRENGLDLYDYEARQMDAAVGRFTTMDPLAEKYYAWSPYHYAANNPMLVTDPTGMDWYQNNETKYYTWYDGNDAREGYIYIGEKGTVLGEFESIIDGILTDPNGYNMKSIYSEGFTFDIAPNDKGGLSSSKERGWNFTDEFANGVGPEFSVLLSTHPYTEAMKTDKTVLEWQQKIADGKTDVPGQATNVSRKWSPLNVFGTTSMAKQFIGSYRYDAFTSSDGKTLNNVISDSKSRTSLFLHLPLSNKNRNQTRDFANTYQFYIWKSSK